MKTVEDRRAIRKVEEEVESAWQTETVDQGKAVKLHVMLNLSFDPCALVLPNEIAAPEPHTRSQCADKGLDAYASNGPNPDLQLQFSPRGKPPLALLGAFLSDNRSLY